MLTLQELIELREKVAKDQISVQLAKVDCWIDLTPESRSWFTRDWKDRRAIFIKDKCEICNSKKTLTIQHLSHPRKYNDWQNEVTRKYVNDLEDANCSIQQNEFIDHIIEHYVYDPVSLCPECEGRKPNERMTKKPKFLCTKCHFEFDKPTFNSIEKIVQIFCDNEDAFEAKDKCFVSKDEWKNRHNLKEIKYWLNRNRTKANHSEKIEKEAFLLYLDDNIKYLSFEDAITACNKCASRKDLNNFELCPKCKEFYKGIQYSTCIQCLPEDKRKIALEKVEFRKQWQATEKELGID